VEHPIDIRQLSERTGIAEHGKLLQLRTYAEQIYSENMKYNLTGHKTLDEIIENLIIGSLEPVKYIDVPRGTLFGDLGTGAGIPGIPLAIKYNESSGVLFDSNQRKIRFINKTVSDMGIDNVKGTDIRVEDAGRDNDYRGKFDFIFTRAMSDIYTISELGAPLLKTGGFIYLYVNEHQIDLTEYLLKHIDELGLTEDIDAIKKRMTDYPVSGGLILTKIKETDDKYPRRMPVIKRMAMK
jgi:16S rRNA (guanine527-N7)-methyltransferase